MIWNGVVLPPSCFFLPEFTFTAINWTAHSLYFVLPIWLAPLLQTLPKPLPTVSAAMLAGDGALVPVPAESGGSVAVYPLHHSLTSPIRRISISWSRGNSLRVSLFTPPSQHHDVGGQILEVNLTNSDHDLTESQWRRIQYDSVSPFALLQESPAFCRVAGACGQVPHRNPHSPNQTRVPLQPVKRNLKPECGYQRNYGRGVHSLGSTDYSRSYSVAEVGLPL